MEIKNFPPDIWAYLVSYLPGEQLGRLKMTGEKLIWAKLLVPNVVKHVILGEDFVTFKRCPAFLSELPSLEELSIQSRSTKWWSSLNLNMSQVPRTVRILTISRAAPDHSILNFFRNETGRILHFDEELPHLEVLNVPGHTSEQLGGLCRCPPSLTKLEIDEGAVSLEFPNTLVHLSVFNGLTESPDLKLPPLLETLACDSLHDLSLLPPPLKSLIINLPIPMESRITPENILHLPRSLTELCLFFTSLPASLWPFLPTTLKKLTFEVSQSACATAIRKMGKPTSNGTLAKTTHEMVTNEMTSQEVVPREVSTLPLELLPISLSHLEIYDQCDITLLVPPSENTSTLPYFPPNLTNLLTEGLHISSDAAKHFPSSLVHLKVDNFCQRICEHLPKGLTHLQARDTLMSPKLTSLLPKSLFTLEMYCTDAYGPWFDYDTGEKFEYKSALQEFEAHKDYGSYMNWQDDQALPPKITTLELHNFTNIGDSFTNQKLPNVLELVLLNSTQFTDAAIPLLNRHLTHLNLASSAKITGKCFPFLPRSLIFLHLKKSTLIYDADIQHLPRTLEVVHLNSAVHLTDICIPDFPRHISVLHLTGNSNITKACFPDLPYPLRISSYKFFSAKWKNLNAPSALQIGTLTDLVYSSIPEYLRGRKRD